MPVDIEVTVRKLSDEGDFTSKDSSKARSISININFDSTLSELASKIIKEFNLNPGEDFGFYDSPNIDDSAIGFETLFDNYRKQAVFSLRDVQGVKDTKIRDVKDLGLRELFFLYDYAEMNIFKVEFKWEEEGQGKGGNSLKGEELDYNTFMELFTPIGENLLIEFKDYFDALYEIARETPAGEFFGKKIGQWLYSILNSRPDRLSVMLGRKIENLLIDIADNELIFNLPGLYIDFPVFKLSLLDLLTDGDAMDIANNVLVSTAYFKDVISTYGDKLNFATTILGEEQGFLPVLAVLRMIIEPKLFFKEPEYIEGDVIDPVSLFVKELYTANSNRENLTLLAILYLAASIISKLDEYLGIKDTIIEAISSDEELESFEDFLQVKINLKGLPKGSVEEELLSYFFDESQKEVTLDNFYTTLINGLYVSITGRELNVFQEEIDDAITILTDFMHQNLRLGVQKTMIKYLSKKYTGGILEILEKLFD